MLSLMAEGTKWPSKWTPLALALLWTGVGLLFATAGGGIQRALTAWYLWGLLAWVMAAIDRRLPRRDRSAVRLAWHIPLSALFAVLYVFLALIVDAVLRRTIPPASAWQEVAQAIPRGGLQWNLLNYWLILGAYLAFDYHREAQERQHRSDHLESLLTEARLSALRAQLHPHFLFNTLNTVSAYVESDPTLARAMLGHLGDLLRFSLDSEGRREVSLDEEIEALDHYLAIQRARFGDRLRTRVDVPPELRLARVPALVLQPLVENAITHGLSELPDVGEIRVSARVREGWLTLTVHDNGVGLDDDWRLERDAGTGLSNTRGRLAEIYGVKHHFSVGPAAGRGVSAEIRVPYAFGSSKESGHFAEAARADRG
jgi:signal transduction histidine kinase